MRKEKKQPDQSVSGIIRDLISVLPTGRPYTLNSIQKILAEALRHQVRTDFLFNALVRGSKVTVTNLGKNKGYEIEIAPLIITAPLKGERVPRPRSQRRRGIRKS